MGDRSLDSARAVGPGVSDAAARAAEDVVPLWLLLGLRDAVRLGVAGHAAAAVVLVVLVLRGLLGC